MVLLYAAVERVGVSRMRDFVFNYVPWTFQLSSTIIICGDFKLLLNTKTNTKSKIIYFSDWYEKMVFVETLNYFLVIIINQKMPTMSFFSTGSVYLGMNIEEGNVNDAES